MKVIKRDGSYVPFDSNKISVALYKVFNATNTFVPESRINAIVDDVSTDISSDLTTVEDIQDIVEKTLMGHHFYDQAKEYILYRDKRTRERKPNIFRPRKEYRPYEYPQMIDYIDAIHQSFWTHNSFSLDSSVQDIKVNMPEHHSSAVIRSILSIASVEAKVKSFWLTLGDRFPMSEFEELGTTIGSNEVYHAHFYAKVLDQLGLNDLFKEVLEDSPIKNRINYMNAAIKNKDGTDFEYMKSILFFSLFVENVSLFSQFLTISVFNKDNPQGKLVDGLAQGISATAIEENLHATVGAHIIKIIREQYPEWFTNELNEEVHYFINECFKAELDIIDWIYEKGELEFLPKNVVIEYIKYRINLGLDMTGFNQFKFNVDERMLKDVEWFDLQTKTTLHRDFFSGHSSNYSKNTQSFSEDDLF